MTNERVATDADVRTDTPQGRVSHPADEFVMIDGVPCQVIQTITGSSSEADPEWWAIVTGA